ncbi:MAG: hypothetical protein H7Y07_14585 [Pyrinomonadaceae bacterium]|nr:hypothetical protein [Sphingobacteriaceae bacterium]
MKKLSIMMLVGIACWATPSKAQISLNINVGSQPQWGPSGYNHAEYYYLPDINSYYYVPEKKFIYLNNGKWAFSNSLPSRYNSYNLYNGYKVVMNTPKPYLYHDQHKVKYAKYKGSSGKQKTLKAVPYGQAKKVVHQQPVARVNVNHSGNQGNGNNHDGNDKGKGKSKGKHK